MLIIAMIMLSSRTTLKRMKPYVSARPVTWLGFGLGLGLGLGLG